MAQLGQVQGVGYICRDIEVAMHAWLRRLGVGPFTWYKGVKMRMDSDGEEGQLLLDVAVAYQGEMQIQVIAQRAGGGSVFTDVLEQNPDQEIVMHHVLYSVDSLQAANVQAAIDQQTVLACGSSDFGKFVMLQDVTLAGLCLSVTELPVAMQKFRSSRIKSATEWQGENPIRVMDMSA